MTMDNMATQSISVPSGGTLLLTRGSHPLQHLFHPRVMRSFPVDAPAPAAKAERCFLHYPIRQPVQHRLPDYTLQQAVTFHAAGEGSHGADEIESLQHFQPLPLRLRGAEPVATVHAGAHQQVAVARQQYSP